MDSERHFRTTSCNSSSTTTTGSASSELFICFTSRLSSSSSMKISSKSILSPNRAREPSQISLSNSLSRRLKTSGSLKGGQASPMFPTGGKKRGCAFENPEPSSPKVTCIGQVRVKTKKQGKKMRAARSQKRRSSTEASFRKPAEQVQSQANCNDQQQFMAKQANLHLNNSNGSNSFQIQNSQQQECLSQHRNQKWVHLPFTICEALRAFGAELNCFLPCHSSCTATNDRDKESKPTRSSESESSCGRTVFARWLVAVDDSDGRGREIELVVGEDEEQTQTEKEMEYENQRRHVFEGMDFKENDEVMEEEEESRIGICIPPKNALLLMRCRSDPVKVAELAKRFCEPTAPKVVEEEEEAEEDDDEGNVQKDSRNEVAVVKEEEEEEETKAELNAKNKNDEELEMNEESGSDGEKEKEQVEDEANVNMQQEDLEIGTEPEIDQEQLDIVLNQNREGGDDDQRVSEDETAPFPISRVSDSEVVIDAEKLESSKEEDDCKSLTGNESELETEGDEKQIIEEQCEEEGESDNGESDKRLASEPTSPSQSVHMEQEIDEAEIEIETDGNLADNVGGSTEEKEETREIHWEDEVKATDEWPDVQNDEMGLNQSKGLETPPPEREIESSVLPDCLLLMMYEPKLSMEVSKETWVCSTDFRVCVPTREKKTHVEKTSGRDAPKKRVSIDCKLAEITQQPQSLLQPPRWSCSFPAQAAIGNGVSMATMIEQKLVSAKAYEPFVLTRCKSEPMRSSTKLAPVPDACFWKDRKLEPHRSATFGVGAAEVGF